jgi:hypothetical protein
MARKFTREYLTKLLEYKENLTRLFRNLTKPKEIWSKFNETFRKSKENLTKPQWKFKNEPPKRHMSPTKQ